ncbi:2-keto-4-pentenoate hydratase [Paracoccus suum]|nr:fumarylacetoacetate hydrolase family protein [Paracoccus suum]
MANETQERQTAVALLELWGTGQQRPGLPVSDMASAYRIAGYIRSLREARGDRVVGRKIGFSNTSIWPLYAVDRPIWNYVWETTVRPASEGRATLSLDPFSEPRIEPEIVFQLARTPEPGMNEAALLGCIDRVALGFEIVQSVFPGWKFSAPAATAAFGLHGALVLGPWSEIGDNGPGWADRLHDFSVTLFKNGAAVETGHARNVLGGPLTALRFLVEAVGQEGAGPQLQAGEIVTTGTLTDAHVISQGETWSADLEGLDLGGLQVAFS